MQEILERLIEFAIEAEDADVQSTILEEVNNILEELTETINCPYEWREIGKYLADTYNTQEYNVVYEALQLYNYAN